jgi:hypothetical protein
MSDQSDPSKWSVDELENWLAAFENLTPDEKRRYSERIPVAERDQAEAAVSETELLLRQGSGTVYETTLPRFLYRNGLEMLARWLSDDVRTCSHHPTMDEPVFAVSWRPDLVVCKQCREMLYNATIGCARCGYTPQEPVLKLESLLFGAFAYQIAICVPCQKEIYDE